MRVVFDSNVLIGGFATAVEAAAITVLDAICTEVFVHRDIRPAKLVRGAGVESTRLVGGHLLLLLAGVLVITYVPALTTALLPK